jgi:HEPN domain-containing protein
MDKSLILEWFIFADSDLTSAEHLISKRPQPWELICYLSEQSAEKFLKGYLVYKGIADPPKIHNLDTLCEMCGNFDSRFDEIKRQCSVLTRYGVQPRYPHEMFIEEHHMKQALEYARQIMTFEPLAVARQELELGKIEK